MSNTRDAFNAIPALPELAALFLAALQTSESTSSTPVSAAVLTALGTLSRREREVVRLIADGLTTRQIAEQLFISPHTVNNHWAQISQKLGLQGAFSLLHFAQQYRHWLWPVQK
ncbi:hypothetical protein GCM10028808_14340 [Spirosoma migulaei]